MSDIIWALSYITNCEFGAKAVIELDILPDLLFDMHLLDLTTETKLLNPVIRTIGNIISSEDSSNTCKIIEYGVIPRLVEHLMNENSLIRKEVLWILSNIAAEHFELKQCLFNDGNSHIISKLKFIFGSFNKTNKNYN